MLRGHVSFVLWLNLQSTVVTNAYKTAQDVSFNVNTFKCKSILFQLVIKSPMELLPISGDRD